jgi:hypothetical protein
MPHAETDASTPRESILINHTLDITPIDAPLFPFPAASQPTVASYLPFYENTFGLDVASWQNRLFDLPDHDIQYHIESSIKPSAPNAPTLVAILYPDDDPLESQRRPLQTYLTRLQRLAKLNTQVIIYVPPSISTKIREMRHDQHWHVIDDYASIWDMPNNKHQRHNFTHVQPRLFDDFERKPGVVGWEPETVYNHPHRSAVYNAKAFVTYDAVMRNPFGSDRWMYVDAGLFDEHGPVGADGELWSDLTCHQLSPEKFDRSIAVSGSSGVVMAEYMQSLAYGVKDINHAAWTDPKKSWMCQHFIAQCHVGSSLGMLNYAVRFMQTVDDMDANGLYTAREEFVVPHVAVRYPNTIFSIPWMDVKWGQWEHPIKGCFLTYGGPKSVPTIGDPIEGMICKGYMRQESRGHLAGGGLYEWPWGKRKSVYGARYY